MSEWQNTTLKNITNKIGSGATPRGGGDTYLSEGISLIRSQNVYDMTFSINGLAHISDDQAYELRNVIVEPEDVLLNITGDSVARCCTVPNNILPARVNQHVAIIRANKRLAHPKFIEYSLCLNKENLLMMSEIGATRKALTKSMIEDFEISLPPLPEQQAIAEVLSSLDDKIDLLHRNNKTLEQMAETLFRKNFNIDEGSSLSKGNIGDYYEETIGGEWGKESLSDEFPVETKCIRGTDIGYLIDGLPNPPTRYLSSTKYNKCKIRHGDLVIEISGGTDDQSTGRARYFDGQTINLLGGSLVFSNFCRLLRPKNPELYPYLYMLNKYIYDRGDFFNLENGSSGIKNLALKAFLFEEQYPLPDQKTALSFSKDVKPFFDKVGYNKLQIAKLAQVRDTLLPKLMSGQVTVNMN
jgi:type I restriction enzyme S subunit